MLLRFSMSMGLRLIEINLNFSCIKMTLSQAERYSQVFKILADPCALVVIDKIFKDRRRYSIEELMLVCTMPEEKLRQILSELESMYVVDRKYEGEIETYKVIETDLGGFVGGVVDEMQ